MVASLCTDCNRIISDTTLDSDSRFKQVVSCKNTCDPESQLEELEAEITRCSKRLNALQSYRPTIKKKINTVVSPLSRLPLDIWTEIFMSYPTPFEDTDHINWNDIFITPLSLGHVCSVWREIAWSIPLLWSSVCVIIHNTAAQVPLLDEWLARSGSCPLSIRITTESSYGDTLLSELIDVIVPYSSRWRFIDFFLPPASFRELAPIKNNLPLLTSLTLSMDLPDGGQVAPKSITAFSMAPQLREVDMRGSFLSSMAVLPWHQLTRFSGNAMDMHECVEVLLQTPNLEQCIFEGMCKDEGSHTLPVAPISLPRLSSISLHTWGSSDIGCMELFDYISETALTDVELSESDFPLDRFLSLSSKSSRPLQRLVLHLLNIHDDQLLRYLRSASSLVELTLDASSITKISSPQRAPVTLPSLKTFTIWSEKTSDISHLLDSLTIPAANEIHFDVKCNEDLFPHSNFHALLVRSACALRSLSFKKTRITEQELSLYLHCVPSLVELKLEDLIPVDNNGALMNEIARILDCGLLVHLESLTFLGVSVFDGDALVDALSSRWYQNIRNGTSATGISRIRTLSIASRSGMRLSKEAIGRLREMKNEGMVVDVLYSRRTKDKRLEG